jgi:hypothetical protein
MPMVRFYLSGGGPQRDFLHAPWDRAIGLTSRAFTPATERLVCLAGTLSDGFEEAATKVLPEMANLRVAETTVQRTTEAAGQRVVEYLRTGGTFGFPHLWESDGLPVVCRQGLVDRFGGQWSRRARRSWANG